MDEPRLGKTGKFPNGKLSNEDIGAINIGVTVAKDKDVIIFNFGHSVSWIGLDTDGALDLINVLKKHLGEIQDRKAKNKS